MRDTQRTDSRGVTQNTRSVRWINGAEAKKQGYASQYRAARVAILRLLGLPSSPDYPVLEDEHMYAKSSVTPRELGDGRKTDAWIWRYGRLKGLDDKGKMEFVLEAERIQWFRAKADMERLIEEIEILEEEFRRLVRSCQSLSSYWSQLADVPPSPFFSRFQLAKSVQTFIEGPQNPYCVYAAQKSALYDKMAKETEKKFRKLGGCWPGETEDLNAFFRRQRPTVTVDWNNVQP
ncbi:hypothetical protein E1B28_006820 [Marasmius oreades]|uniref:Uncharacterized protein n=1 Tax=Marasmius oreades TaxID=181124 RepID=A0A9P8AAS9_9AGAR|nr:uncharacterized protein E1B28_006820 [Marasmius oreades]KAG7096147.1 hypothetical protein E1B28_006820 [Marasmius oreades]